MHLVEKIGNLILVSLEDQVLEGDIAAIKRQLEELSEQDDEAVVSLNVSNLYGSNVPIKEEAKKGYDEIIGFCKEAGIGIYTSLLE
ncbi:MAG: hypothetical protein GY940_31610 [bacterium]|nr:hypothetical protein [bacterium]